MGLSKLIYVVFCGCLLFKFVTMSDSEEILPYEPIFQEFAAKDSSGKNSKYSHVIEPIVPGHVVELSGIIGTKPKDPKIPDKDQVPELIEGGLESELKRIFQLVEAQLKEAGLSLRNVMKIEVKLAGPLTDESGNNSEDFACMNEVYSGKVGKLSPPPARYTVGGLKLWLNARIELVVTAWREDEDSDVAEQSGSKDKFRAVG